MLLRRIVCTKDDAQNQPKAGIAPGLRRSLLQKVDDPIGQALFA